MIKVKKSISLLIVIFLILSNIALAQSFSDSSSYEGRPIDPSKEGVEYYREGNVIVYPAKISSQEKGMMERFTKGDFSGEEMRKIAKAKFGKDFDEMEFERDFMEFKERRDRKEAFSYEHEGYEQRYYVGPSYEGYSKERMIFAMLFEHIGDEIDPREIKQQCNEPEKIADTVIAKLKNKLGDFQTICSRFEEQEAKCVENSKKGCSQLGSAFVRDDATELEKLQSVAYSCPPNKDAIVEACKKRGKIQLEQSTRQSGESCERMFEHEGERFLRECGRFKENQICERDKYIERCMGGIRKEDFEKPICPAYPAPQCGEGTKLVTRTDSNGCASYHCETACPIRDVPQCSENQVLQKRFDEKGCVSYYCEARVVQQACKETDNGYDIFTRGTTYPQGTDGKSDVCVNEKTLAEYGCNTDGHYGGDRQYTCEFGCKEGACLRSAQNVCPETIMPICQSGQTLQKKTDEKGCISYYCEQTSVCPEAKEIPCASGQTLQKRTDEKGCVYYFCESTCPSVQKPACAEGQSMTTKYDEKGCITGYECVTVTTTSNQSITGYVVLSTYEDFLRRCESQWREQERTCATMAESCEKDALIEKCKAQSRKNHEELALKLEKHCDTDTLPEIRHAEERCARIDKDRQRCLEDSAKRCEQIKGTAEKCRETLTEENVRKFIIEEIRKRCKFTDIVQDEDDVRESDKVEIVLAVLNTATEKDLDKLELFIEGLEKELELQDTTVYKGMIEPNRFGDIKLLPFVVNAKISAVQSSERAKEVKTKIVARQKVEEAAGKLASLRDSDVPAEFLYIIEDKASDVLNVSDTLEDVEKKEGQKGIGYKIRLFLGLAKAAEQEEIKQLDESKSKLKNSIETLTKLVDEVPSDIAKAILKEQVENLKNQQTDIEVLIEAKQKKAKGFFGVFG
ncbi:hypothetical protein HYX02_02680 [Candidatus Woesearchaeota archaeon]|nr:hypothetical protein [Candidatus Woesearchaeota archaeon]